MYSSSQPHFALASIGIFSHFSRMVYFIRNYEHCRKLMRLQRILLGCSLRKSARERCGFIIGMGVREIYIVAIFQTYTSATRIISAIFTIYRRNSGIISAIFRFYTKRRGRSKQPLPSIRSVPPERFVPSPFVL